MVTQNLFDNHEVHNDGSLWRVKLLQVVEHLALRRLATDLLPIVLYTLAKLEVLRKLGINLATTIEYDNGLLCEPTQHI